MYLFLFFVNHLNFFFYNLIFLGAVILEKSLRLAFLRKLKVLVI
jgi:hypothetical protein